MNHNGYFFSQAALQRAASRILTVLLYEGVDGLLVKAGEYLDVALCVVIANVEPELIELVRRCALRVEPDVSALCLAELLAVGLGYQRTCQRVSLSLAAERAAYKLGSGGHVAPLIVAAHLQLAALVLIEIQEVVALKQLIGELGK